jgi:hypothetical protein
MTIKDQADQEIEASRDGDADIAFLLPEDRWDEFLSLTGAGPRANRRRPPIAAFASSARR